MTPLEKAQQLLDDIEAYFDVNDANLPGLRYVQIGQPQITCEVATVAVLDVVPHDQYGPLECNPSQLSTFLVIIAWDCSWTSETDGTDDPRKVAEVSARLDATGSLLWGFAAQYVAYLSKQWNITWALVGGVGITTMQFTIGVD